MHCTIDPPWGALVKCCFFLLYVDNCCDVYLEGWMWKGSNCFIIQQHIELFHY